MSESLPEVRLPDAIPNELPVLALLKGVLLPTEVASYHVGRAPSIAALDEVGDDQLLLVVPQSQPVRDPSTGDLLPWGTLARVLKDQRRNGGRIVLVQGLARVQLDGFPRTQPGFRARFTVHEESWPETPEAEALVRTFVETVREAGDHLGEQVRVRALLDAYGQRTLLVDAVAAALQLDEAVDRELLLTIDPVHRGERVLKEVRRAREVLAAQADLQKRLRDETRDKQREVFLRQQLDAIKKELGEGDSDELAALRDQLGERALPEEAREAVDRELARLDRIPSASPERGTAIDWLTWIADLPWSAYSADDLDFDALERTLDESHFGLDDVKRQVIEHLSVRKLSGSGHADVLLLVGPPGVGKTSIGNAIAEATGRKLVRVALGGVRDEAELRGHRRTYVGARPGRLVEGFRRAGTADPVVLLDEVDKLGRSMLGDPASALLEILDPEQNHAFTDHYLEVPFDLSRALFIATANDLGGLPPALRDRMEVIELSGYTPTEKRTIARQHLLAKAAKAAGLDPDDVVLDDDALDAVITGWTREAGVRQLQRTLGRLYRAAAVRKARGTLDGPLVLTTDDLADHLKRPPFRRQDTDRPDRPGIATGLAWTPAGGDVLLVEASTLPGKGALVLTGQLGDVMKESARAALTYVLHHAESLGVDPGHVGTRDVHIHVPAGAVPKDGPSAGVTMFTALASLLTGRPVRPDLAMTGEATLRGRVLPVGGIKSKVLAAHREGYTHVILPSRNGPDLEDVPDDVRAALTVHLVDHMDEVLALALAEPGAPEVDATGSVATLAADPT